MTLLPFMSTPPSSSQKLNDSRCKDQLTRNYFSDVDRVGQGVEINVRKNVSLSLFSEITIGLFGKLQDCILDRRYFTVAMKCALILIAIRSEHNVIYVINIRYLHIYVNSRDYL